eukprot:g5306.t1
MPRSGRSLRKRLATCRTAGDNVPDYERNEAPRFLGRPLLPEVFGLGNATEAATIRAHGEDYRSRAERYRKQRLQQQSPSLRLAHKIWLHCHGRAPVAHSIALGLVMSATRLKLIRERAEALAGRGGGSAAANGDEAGGGSAAANGDDSEKMKRCCDDLAKFLTEKLGPADIRELISLLASQTFNTTNEAAGTMPIAAPRGSLISSQTSNTTKAAATTSAAAAGSQPVTEDDRLALDISTHEKSAWAGALGFGRGATGRQARPGSQAVTRGGDAFAGSPRDI